MKTLISLLLVFSNIFCFSQNIGPFTTKYSQVGDEPYGKENFTFTIKNGVLTKTDNDYNIKDTYPLKLGNYGYVSGLYCEVYILNIVGDYFDPYINDIRKYSFYYYEKNGLLYGIIEEKTVSGTTYTKKFGNEDTFGISSTTQTTSDTELDIEFEYANANSLQSFYNKFTLTYSDINPVIGDGENETTYKTKYYYSLEEVNNSTDAIIFTFNDKDEISGMSWHTTKVNSSVITKELDLYCKYFKSDDGSFWYNEKTGLYYMISYDGLKAIIYAIKDI